MFCVDAIVPVHEKTWLTRLESRSTTPQPIRKIELQEQLTALTSSLTSLTGSFANLGRRSDVARLSRSQPLQTIKPNCT